MKIRTDSTIVHFFYLLALRTNRTKFLEICKRCGIDNTRVNLTLKIDKEFITIDKINLEGSMIHLGSTIEEEEEHHVKQQYINAGTIGETIAEEHL